MYCSLNVVNKRTDLVNGPMDTILIIVTTSLYKQTYSTYMYGSQFAVSRFASLDLTLASSASSHPLIVYNPITRI